MTPINFTRVKLRRILLLLIKYTNRINKNKFIYINFLDKIKYIYICIYIKIASKMKTVKITLFLVGILLGIIACQQGSDLDFAENLKTNEKSILDLGARSKSEIVREYMPLGMIPKWVKFRVSSEEYELWKVLSSKYEVDYSILLTELTASQKQQVDSILISCVQDIRLGKIEEYAGLFTFCRLTESGNESLEIERLSNSESEGLEYRIAAGTIYSSPSVDARVVASVRCRVDVGRQEIISAEHPIISVEGRAAVSFHGTGVSNVATRLVMVTVNGTFVHKLNSGATSSVKVNKTVRLGVIF